MTLIQVGLTTADLTSLAHKSITVAQSPGVSLRGYGDGTAFESKSPVRFDLTPDGRISCRFGKFSKIEFASGVYLIPALKRASHYRGTLRLFVAPRGGLRISLGLSLDSYLEGVLSSEMPASYHLEALKGQALCARTYALNPRISHKSDGVDVCDSYLCCQYFAGHGKQLDARIKRAIHDTSCEIITYADSPILALFSSNAGGHTEDYQNSFSDPQTGAFPPPPLPYLKGVPEGDFARAGFTGEVGTEAFLRFLHAKVALKSALCVDNWSPKFSFTHVIEADAIESHLHHNIKVLQGEPESAPFIKGASTFGHVKRLVVKKRGVSGQAITLAIETSHGVCTLSKELVIRKAFAGLAPGLKRLSSARVFFDHSTDSLGLLASLRVSGLGFGHGVGFQQQGAHGHALAGRDYRAIIEHYYAGTKIVKA